MREIRIFVAHALTPGSECTLDQRAHQHVVRVLRMTGGAAITLFNGDGHDYSAELTLVTKKEARAQVHKCKRADTESALQITLIQGISRGERMDITLQKSVELGVARICPVWTERSQVRLQGDRLDKRMQHWRGVILHACEQSGRALVPQLEHPRPLSDWLERRTPDAATLLLDPTARQTINKLSLTQEVDVLIGPEGGFSDAERSQAYSAGCIGVRLGPRILRTETAALTALAVLQAHCGDLG